MQAEIEQVLKEYTRPVLAMRKAHQERRFGLILGAGISQAFQFEVPGWPRLLADIAAHPKVNGLSVDNPLSSPTSRSDLLFRHFAYHARRELETTPESMSAAEELVGRAPDSRTIERIIKGEWLGIIRDILYKAAPPPNKLRSLHPYLGEYLDIIMNAPLTITYNFDSFLEMMLAHHKAEGHARPYETVFDGSVPFRSRDGVIYHPNGYLPLNVLERASDHLVFSEEEFGDQLLDSIAGRYSSLAHHISKNVCLLMGLSLADENLRHFLRRNATSNPGHYHYIVEYLESKDAIPKARRTALFEYRFTVYNLITLFLTNEQIAALGNLIKAPQDEFLALAKRLGVRTKYVFYLTGIPGIGKTTTLRHLASLRTYDEWPTDPLPLLAKPHHDLTDHEKNELDDWVAKQFRVKNEALIDEKEGIFVIERAPLDPVSFVSETEIAAKAAVYRPKLVPTSWDKICPGRVILLFGDTGIVAGRIVSRQTIRQPSTYLDDLQRKLCELIYAAPGVLKLRSTEWRVAEMVRAVAREIHRGDYYEVDLGVLLESLAGPNRDG